MTTYNDESGPVAALNIPRLTKYIITFSWGVHDHIKDNKAFPNPVPTLKVFEEDILALEDAEIKAADRGKGAAKLRNAKRKKVREDLLHLRDYVQSVVETETTPANAVALIESAFMSVRKTPKRTKADLSASNTDVKGTVAVTAKAVATAATYYWEYSLDQVTWSSAPATMQANTLISDLTSTKVYYFRFRALTRKGPRDYSQVVSLLVR